VRETGATPSASKLFPSGVRTSPDGIPPLHSADWTPAMKALVDYAQRVGSALIDRVVHVTLHDDRRLDHAGTFGLSGLGLNLAQFDWHDKASVDALLIHEFAHARASDHLTPAFYDECCRLGAKWVSLAHTPAEPLWPDVLTPQAVR
jgi:hypothetical protein